MQSRAAAGAVEQCAAIIWNGVELHEAELGQNRTWCRVLADMKLSGQVGRAE